MDAAAHLSIHLEFGGGVELITRTPKQKRHTLRLPTRVPPSPTSFEESVRLVGSRVGKHTHSTIPDTVARDSAPSASEQPAAPSTATPHAAPPPTPAASDPPTNDGASTAHGAAAAAVGVDMRYLVHYLLRNLVVERPEMLVDADNVRPGILVLINDADWELEGELNYQLRDGDEVCFISTLHGG